MLESFFNTIWLGFSNHTWTIVGGFIILWLILIAMYLFGAVIMSCAKKTGTVISGSAIVFFGVVGMQVMGIITPVYLVLVFISWILRLAS